MLARRDASLVGGGAFRTRRAGPVRLTTWLGGTRLPDLLEAPGGDGGAERVLETALERSHALWLPHTPVGGAAWRALDAVAPWRAAAPVSPCGWMVDLPPARLDHARHKAEYAVRRAERRGAAVAVSVWHEPEDVGAAFERLVELYRDQWRGRESVGSRHSDVVSGADRYRELLPALAAAGSVRMVEVLEDDHVAATKLGLLAGRGALFHTTATAPRANLRGPGEDVRAGDVVLRTGTPLGPAELGVAVAAGLGEIPCARRPRVAVLATGDELVAAGAPLAPGQIHNTNGIALSALAARAGADVVLQATVPDDREATDIAVAGAIEAADVMLVSGGVSVGPHDHVKPALAGLGVQERFWRVELKPGKPTWFGTRDDRLVLGLPGNPVSSYVTFVLFAAPALRALQGAEPLPARRRARLAERVPRLPDREQAVRVRVDERDDGPVATPTGAQGSHRLSSMLGAGALAMVPAGEGEATEAELEPLP